MNTGALPNHQWSSMDAKLGEHPLSATPARTVKAPKAHTAILLQAQSCSNDLSEKPTTVIEANFNLEDKNQPFVRSKPNQNRAYVLVPNAPYRDCSKPNRNQNRPEWTVIQQDLDAVRKCIDSVQWSGPEWDRIYDILLACHEIEEEMNSLQK
ncbi:hypothetical protein GALMADRAFT_216879 [Galerina marginata CBS 339.88]|uniref:Uncharacterized protein n=1 Tax=Galerina marginata (strain CBS 339.88) TaxID=685588 RepID=A0A067S736_GALM3|nr:hypothetical protein GALMADRAFT_216879 [Galerina marginata CBS 339.88]